MPSRRMIDPSFWQSETVATLPLSARYLFIGLFSNADDQGRMKANPALIRSKVYPLDDIGLDSIAADLDKLEAGEFISRYEADGSRYLQVINWWKHQHPTWAWPSELPAPEGWTDRACYRKGNVVVKSNWPNSEAEPEVASGESGTTVTPPRPHDDVTVTLAPSGSGSGSGSISISGSKAVAVEAAVAVTKEGGDTKSQILPAAALPSADDCFADALMVLAGYGIDEPKAREITGKCGADWVLAWRDEIRRRGDKVHSPAGMIVKMALAGSPFPKDAGPPDNGRERRKRWIEGEYADIIQH